MKHLRKGGKFSRKKKQRKALFKILVGELFLRSKIKTTEAKAKELKALADKICGKIKRSFSDSDEEQREVKILRYMKTIFPKNIEPKLLLEVAKSLPQQKSGFVRVIKIPARRSDGAKMALVEIIKKEKEEKR